ncbi:hypothetical protein [Kitasatospora paranensis]|uniref:Uncharacterized protein n=1 Tax=Kitasatospora paranensis TaxID=258053 RepID=A0ABW2G2Z9_9ACTN
MTARDLPIDLLVDPALVLPASKRRALPPVTVVLDRGDDARFTAAALAASRPRAGCITIHPTVGTARTDVLLHDHLTALGRSVVNLRTQGLAQEAAAERAVRAWMWAEGIRHVIVLRSHLPRLRLHYLLDLHAATGAALTVVWHAPALGRDLERLLNSVNHRVVDTLHAAREAFHTPFVRACRCPGRPPRARILIPGWDTPVAALPPAVVLERIRRHIPHPLYAAALTAAWTTGASPHLLRGARLQDLTPRGDALALPMAASPGPGPVSRHGTRETFRIPARLRPHLLAAAHYRHLEDAGPGARLFAGIRADRLSAMATTCGLRVRA